MCDGRVVGSRWREVRVCVIFACIACIVASATVKERDTQEKQEAHHEVIQGTTVVLEEGSR